MTELFEKLCPIYLVYGMTYEQYWYGDPWMVKDYAEAYLLKRKSNNEDLWLQGLYIYRAVHAVIASAFGGRSEKYITKPVDYLPKTKEEKRLEELEKRQKVIDYLNTFTLMSRKSNKGVDQNGES